MKKTFKRNKQKLLLVGVFIIGLGIFLYPNLSNIYAEYSQAVTILDYKNEYKKMDEQLKDLEIERLKEYNASLENGVIDYVDPFVEVEDLKEDRVDERLGKPLGHIEIPQIDVDIPIYNGTTDYILQRGIGLLGNSSMPIGGESTHATLTGHRGLPNAELFSDLVELVNGDVFYIHSVVGTLAYEVESIQTVLPYETESLAIQKGRDLVTLITCTPYMINTHRILVTGKRIPYVALPTSEEQSLLKGRTLVQVAAENENNLWLFGTLSVMLTVIIFILLHHKKKRGGDQHVS